MNGSQQHPQLAEKADFPRAAFPSEVFWSSDCCVEGWVSTPQGGTLVAQILPLDRIHGEVAVEVPLADGTLDVISASEFAWVREKGRGEPPALMPKTAIVQIWDSEYSPNPPRL